MNAQTIVLAAALFSAPLANLGCATSSSPPSSAEVEASSSTTPLAPLAQTSAAEASAQTAAMSKAEKVKALLERGIGQGDVALADALLGPSYTQHNPRVPDGREGLLSYLRFLRTAPASERVGVDVVRVIVDGDYAFAHSRYVRHGHEVAGIDVFRFDGEHFAEHWDAGQAQGAPNASGRTLLDGPVSVTDREHTAENKALVRHFVDTVLVAGDERGFDTFTDGVYRQHNPSAGDGTTAVKAFFAAMREKGFSLHYEVKRVLGEGNFVLVHAKANIGGSDTVVYDLFRVENGKVAEHWDVIEAVPATAANDNGMF